MNVPPNSAPQDAPKIRKGTWITIASVCLGIGFGYDKGPIPTLILITGFFFVQVVIVSAILETKPEK
jgi:hypothetical protein